MLFRSVLVSFAIGLLHLKLLCILVEYFSGSIYDLSSTKQRQAVFLTVLDSSSKSFKLVLIITGEVF